MYSQSPYRKNNRPGRKKRIQPGNHFTNHCHFRRQCYQHYPFRYSTLIRMADISEKIIITLKWWMIKSSYHSCNFFMRSAMIRSFSSIVLSFSSIVLSFSTTVLPISSIFRSRSASSPRISSSMSIA